MGVAVLHSFMSLKIPAPFIQKCAILAGIACLALFFSVMLATTVTTESLVSLFLWPPDHPNPLIPGMLALGCMAGTFLLCWACRKA